jgi:hypothetical protein
MNVLYKNNSRSTQAEIMDDFKLSGTELKKLLTDLRVVNTYLGGQAITLNGLSKLLVGCDIKQEITIVDIGCGDGEMLRVCADFAKKKGFRFKLIGVDANAYIINLAREQSIEYESINYICCNIFSETFEALEYDIAVCTLFLHHFPEQQVGPLLDKFCSKSKVGVIINDLHRSWIAFTLFKVFSTFFIKTRIAKHDGLVSVARAFKRKELEAHQAHLNYVTSSLHWKWAFRWQWILKKNN